MREPLSNIGLVCSDHTPKPGAYKDRPLDSFLGKFCKLAFPISEIPGKKRPNFEHMWVEVLRVEGDELIGRLDNDPLYVTEYSFDDELAFKTQEIEDIDVGVYYFGENWGAPFLEDARQITTPVGKKCHICQDEIVAGEQGSLSGEDPVHRECLLRGVLGGIAHVEKRCTCFGGTAEADDGLTYRESAKKVLEFAKKKPCPFCDGRGSTLAAVADRDPSIPCDKCNGSGVIDREQP